MISFYESNKSAYMGEEKTYNSLEELYNNMEVRQCDVIEKGGNAKQFFMIPSGTVCAPENVTPTCVKRNAFGAIDLEYRNDPNDIHPSFITDDRGALRRKKVNTDRFTVLFADVDNVYDRSIIEKTWNHLKELNLGAIVYPSASFGKKTEDGKTKYNFRLIIEISEAVSLDDWFWAYESMESFLGIELDRAFQKNSVQFIIAPYETTYHRENNIPIKIGFRSGNALDVQPHIEAGRVLKALAEQKALEEKEERLAASRARKKAREELGRHYDGVVDPKTPIISQIDFDKLDINDWRMFVSDAGMKITTDSGNKFNFHCDGGHSNNDTEAYMMEGDGTPIYHCSHNSCSYNHKPLTSFLEAHRGSVPQEWIRGTLGMANVTLEALAAPVSSIKEITPDKACEVEELEAKGVIEGLHYDDNPYHFLTAPEKSSIGMYATGYGKTHSAINYTLDCVKAGDKIVIFVPTKKAITDFISDFRVLLEGSSLTKEEQMRYIPRAVHSANTRVDDNDLIVVTHYHYLKRRGQSDKLFSIIQWIIENKPVVLADEIDTIFTTLADSIDLNGRYLKERDNEILKTKCISRSSHRYRCQECKMRDKVSYESEFMNLGMPRLNKANIHDSSLTKIDDLPELQAIESEDVIYKSSLHELNCSYLKKATVEDTEISDDSFLLFETFNSNFIKKWVKHIVATSDLAYIVSAVPVERRDIYVNLATEAKATFDYDKEYESEKEMEKQLTSHMTKYIHKAIMDESRSDVQDYPYHTCGVKQLKYFDTYALKEVIKAASRIRLMTATLSDNQVAKIKDIFPGIKWFGGTKPKFKAIDDLLIVTARDEFDGEAHYGKLSKNSLDLAETVKIGDQRRVIKKTLYFQKSEADLEKMMKINATQKAHGGIGSSFYLQDNLSTDICGSAWGMLRTIARGAMARGVNLGDFSSSYIDYGSVKPMIHYNYNEESSLDDARHNEHIVLLKQAMGRIMRKAIIQEDGKTTDLESHHRRFMGIGGCHQELTTKDEQGKLQVKDYSGFVAEKLNSEFMDMVNNSVKSIALERNQYWDSADLVSIMMEIQRAWIEDGKINILPPTIPGEICTYRKYETALSKYPQLKFFMDEDQWTIYKYTFKLKQLESKYPELSGRERQRKCNWNRFKSEIPSELLPLYENFMDV